MQKQLISDKEIASLKFDPILLLVEVKHDNLLAKNMASILFLQSILMI